VDVVVQSLTAEMGEELEKSVTVYHLLGEPVPAGLDGRVATAILKP
jgi:hypothetical protein